MRFKFVSAEFAERVPRKTRRIIDQEADWRKRCGFSENPVRAVALGKVRSSGDLFGVRGVGIFATVDVGTEPNDYLASIDPVTSSSPAGSSLPRAADPVRGSR